MKKITFTIGLFLFFTLNSFGQINPVLNLTWHQIYIYPDNIFELAWDEPASPHDELIGYNVYREDELYRFQTETSLNNSNCGVDFLIYANGEPFYAHVTAVYNPGAVESDYTETVFVGGPLIGINDYTSQKAILYPNPSHGILNVRLKTPPAEPLAMNIFDVLGKKVHSTTLNNENTTLDLGFLENGVYAAVFKSDEEVFVKRIVLDRR